MRNPLGKKYYGGNAWDGRESGKDAAKRAEAAEASAIFNEIKSCRKCVRSQDGYALCRKHRKPKYVKAAAKGM